MQPPTVLYYYPSPFLMSRRDREKSFDDKLRARLKVMMGEEGYQRAMDRWIARINLCKSKRFTAQFGNPNGRVLFF